MFRGRVRFISFVAALALVGSVTTLTASPVAAAADSPSVALATGGAGVPIVYGSFEAVETVGYQTAEYFVSGDARSYTSSAALTADGKWDSVSANPTTAPFTTRAIVHTPQKPSDFNGTVYVEWLNVSGLVDGAPDWVHGHLEAVRQGAAFILVSAQQAGLNQLKTGNIVAPAGDPVRYAALDHPGDSYSYDIFSQVGQAVRDGDLLGDLEPTHIIAVGESQSASRLHTYVNGVHPLVEVYDGFLLHSRGGTSGGADLSQEPLPAITPPELAHVRDDGDPVIMFQAEGDVAGSGALRRQPDSGNFRLWEVPGNAHFDLYGLTIGLTDNGDGQAEINNLDQMRAGPTREPQEGFDCAFPINSGPMHWVIHAALHSLNEWVRNATPPPPAPRIDVVGTGDDFEFAVDQHGNVLGGIRTPYVDVPIARLNGAGNGPASAESSPLSRFCGSFGVTDPFSDEKLAALYPTHADFVSQYEDAVDSAVASEFLLAEDGAAMLRAAQVSRVGRFPDVPAGTFYDDAVEWMKAQGITTGTSSTTFSPNDGTTRGQMATFLYRYAGEPAGSPSHGFTDVPAGAYYDDAVSWMRAEGITTGTSPTTFSPDDPLTRGQAAALLYRYSGKPAGSPPHGFTDVPAGAYYAAAVDWMRAEGITTGTSSTTFSPLQPVTRGQAATFLYRHDATA